MGYLTIHFKLKHQIWPGDGSIKVELFSDHILQPEGLVVTNSRSFLFFIIMSIKRSWLQNKNKFNFLKVFWESTSKVTYFVKRFLYGLLVLCPLPKESETSFWCTFFACFLSYKYCLFNCVSIDQVSIPDLLNFSLCFLVLKMMTSQISRFIFDHLCNGWQWRKESKVCLQKCEYLEIENFLDQIKAWFLKGLLFEEY